MPPTLQGIAYLQSARESQKLVSSPINNIKGEHKFLKSVAKVLHFFDMAIFFEKII